MNIPSVEIKGIKFTPSKVVESDPEQPPKEPKPSECVVTMAFCCDEDEGMKALRDLLAFAQKGPTSITIEAQREMAGAR